MLIGRKLPLALAFVALLSLAVGVSCRGFFVKPTLTAVAISPPTPTITNGSTNNTQQFTVVGTFDDGSHGSTPVSWTSGTTSVATINSSGLATAAGLGTSQITATSTILPSISNSTTLTVTLPCIQSIAVTPTSPSITQGNTQQFQAEATPCSGGGGQQNITDFATWNSSNTSVATISSSGLATSITTGTTNITASSGGVVSNTAVLTVN